MTLPHHPARTAVLFLALALHLPASARAQARAAEPTVTIQGGIIELSPAGRSRLFFATAVRGTWTVTSNLGVEAGGLLTRYDSAPDATTLFIPEAQLHYHWRARSVVPYVGGGVGVAWRHHHGSATITLSVSGAGGVRAPVSERVALLAEVRVRHFGRHAVEVMGGASFRLGSRP
jgi:hypothetical protein